MVLENPNHPSISRGRAEPETENFRCASLSNPRENGPGSPFPPFLPSFLPALTTLTYFPLSAKVYFTREIRELIYGWVSVEAANLLAREIPEFSCLQWNL